MTNFILEPETNFETMGYILRQQVRQARKFKPTIPFHTARQCEDKTKCLFHNRRKKK